MPTTNAIPGPEPEHPVPPPLEHPPHHDPHVADAVLCKAIDALVSMNTQLLQVNLVLQKQLEQAAQAGPAMLPFLLQAMQQAQQVQQLAHETRPAPPSSNLIPLVGYCPHCKADKDAQDRSSTCWQCKTPLQNVRIRLPESEEPMKPV